MRVRARSASAVVVFLAVCCMLPGCAVRNKLAIDGAGSFAATPSGPSAVLRVTVPPAKEPRSKDILWGSVNTLEADSQFAELVAYAAAKDGKIAAPRVFEVHDRLEKAGLEPTLQPTPEELRRYVETLGCSSYLTADLKRWHYGYLLFFGSADIEYHLACHRADNDEIVWEANVLRQACGMSDRDVARLALRETFQWLIERDRIGASASPPAEPQ